MKNVIIGKRITAGAAINSIGAVFAHIYPDYAPAIISACVPITFVVQIILVNKYGVTGA